MAFRKPYIDIIKGGIIMRTEEVRILPCNNGNGGEFDGVTPDKFQKDYLLDELPNKNKYVYKYIGSGLNSKPGSVVLFQIGGYIVGMAEYLDCSSLQSGGQYKGEIKFVPGSIKVFDKIDYNTFTTIWPDFKGFCQTKWSLPVDKLDDFLRFILTRNLRSI